MATLAPLVISGGRHQQVQSADVLNVPNAGTTSLPSLILAGDVNTGLWHPAADTLAISTNAVERVRFGTTEVVFNDNGVDADFRVEGVGRANLLLIDAGLARVGINRAAGAHGATLDVDNLAVAESIFIARDNGTAVFTIADGGAVTSTSTSFTIGGAGTMTWPSANAAGVLTNNGSGTLTWAAGGSGESAWTLTTTSVDKTIVDHERCFVLASGKTITLPASPSAGNAVTIGVLNFTDTIVARNGSNIMGAAEDFTIDTADTAVTFVYVDATRGWRLI